MLGNVGSSVIRGASFIVLKIMKYSPEIGMGLGLVTGAGAVVSAINATLDVKEEVLDNAEEQLQKIEGTKQEHPESYPDDCYKKDIMEVRKDTAIGIVKLYYPTVLLFAASTFCYFGSFKIMKGRYLGTLAALKLTQEALDRANAENEQLRKALPSGQKDISSIEDGEPSAQKEELVTRNPNEHSQYARFFDEGSKEWSKTPEFNLLFLKAKQEYFNNLLQARGHVFLNEVYDALDIPRSQAGSVVGWILGKNNDNYIDFGIYDLMNSQKRAFVNGSEPSILLDFNVDGVIYDLI